MSRSLSAAVIALSICGACSLVVSREDAIGRAVDQVRESMRVGMPDLPHPTPYEYQDRGDCAWVPGLNSTKETLTYQVEVPLPLGDNGLERQARVVRHWTNKGAAVRDLPYRNGPPAEVEYRGGRIMAFPLLRHGRGRGSDDSFTFHILATTPCVLKAQQ